MTRRLRQILSNDDGVGMILVIGTAMFITALVVAATTVALNGLGQSAKREKFEKSLATAENGVDWALAKLQISFDLYNRDYPVPSPPTSVEPSPSCNAPVMNYPNNGLGVPDPVFASEAAERAWASSKLQTLATTPGCLKISDNGDYAVLKPPTPLVGGAYPKFGKVYSMSWLPHYGAAGAATRMVKAEYIFMPYRPTNAVLTGGTLSVDASTTVQSAFGVDPSIASIHTNGSLSVNGQPTVTGLVTATGSVSGGSNNFALNPGGTVQPSTLQNIPKVSALTLYRQAAGNDPSAVATYWRDLCPDGSIRAYNPAGVPCGSATIHNETSPGVYSLPFLGWNYNPTSHTWSVNRDGASGVWFAAEANVATVNGPDPHFPNFTVIASAQNPSNCTAKRYGNIQWDHHSIAAPAFKNTWMFADTDIVTSANFTAGSGTTSAPVISGMFVASDQIHLLTSSAGAVGSVVAADQCASPVSPGNGLISDNEIKNPTIWYDPNSDAPFTSVIDRTLWLDYSG